MPLPEPSILQHVKEGHALTAEEFDTLREVARQLNWDSEGAHDSACSKVTLGYALFAVDLEILRSAAEAMPPLPKIKSQYSSEEFRLSGKRNELKGAMATELEARTRLTQLQRELQHARINAATGGVAARNRASANEMRGRLDVMHHRDLKASMTNVEAATPEEVRTLSEQLNLKMCELIEDPAARSWFKLYKHMDDDGSGKMSYIELAGMVCGRTRTEPLGPASHSSPLT